jgi:chromosome partitioning protein
MRIIAVTNQKGGSAKTTTVVHLATALAQLKRRVLVVDMDGQGNATMFLGAVPDGQPLLDVLQTTGDLLKIVQRTEYGVDVVGGGLALEGIDVSLYNAKKDRAAVQLRRALRPIADNWDYVFIDCPPNLGVATSSALLAATAVLIPVAADAMSLQGTTRLRDNLADICREFEIELPIVGVLPSVCVEREKLTRVIVASLVEQFGPTVVFSTHIKRNTAIAQAYATGAPLHKYDPKNELIPQYEAVARELIKRCEKKKRKERVASAEA